MLTILLFIMTKSLIIIFMRFMNVYVHVCVKNIFKPG